MVNAFPSIPACGSSCRTGGPSFGYATCPADTPHDGQCGTFGQELRVNGHIWQASQFQGTGCAQALCLLAICIATGRDGMRCASLSHHGNRAVARARKVCVGGQVWGGKRGPPLAASAKPLAIQTEVNKGFAGSLYWNRLS
uniref:Uncharacterized protein n=1 Tax=Eutreptiella gymnastica TaxID=73025 RepID=A0A7S1JEV3_9EUGL